MSLEAVGGVIKGSMLSLSALLMVVIFLLSFKKSWLTKKVALGAAFISTVYGLINLGSLVILFLPFGMAMGGGGVNPFWTTTATLGFLICPVVVLFALINLWVQYRLENYQRVLRFAALSFLGPIVLFATIQLAALGPKSSIKYSAYQEKADQLNREVVLKIDCANSYTWQITHSAQVEAGENSLYISLRRVLQLLNSQGQLIADDKMILPRPSLVRGYQKAYITPESVETMRSRLPERSTREYYISPTVVDEANFDIVAQCLGKNLPTINEALATPPEGADFELRPSALEPLSRIYLLDPKENDPIFVCTDGAKIRSDDQFLTLLTPNFRYGDPTISILVGPHGELIPTPSKDESSGKNIRKPDASYLELRKKVMEDTCVNKEGHNLRDVIMSLPERLRMFPTSTSKETIIPRQPISTEYDKEIIDNNKKAYQALWEYHKQYNTFKGFSLESVGIPRQVHPDVCSGTLTVDISPSGDTFVLHQPYCIDPQWSFCGEQGSTKYVTTFTDAVKTTYRCQ